MLKPELMGPEGLCIQIQYEEQYEPYIIETNILPNEKYEQLLSLVTKTKTKKTKSNTKRKLIGKRISKKKPF
jgi:hypothetical protein